MLWALEGPYPFLHPLAVIWGFPIGLTAAATFRKERYRGLGNAFGQAALAAWVISSLVLLAPMPSPPGVSLEAALLGFPLLLVIGAWLGKSLTKSYALREAEAARHHYGSRTQPRAHW